MVLICCFVCLFGDCKLSLAGYKFELGPCGRVIKEMIDMHFPGLGSLNFDDCIIICNTGVFILFVVVFISPLTLAYVNTVIIDTAVSSHCSFFFFFFFRRVFFARL